MLPLMSNERLTILIDDDPFVLKLVGKQLASAGVNKLLTFDSAQAALTKIKEDPYSVGLVVTDLQMPQIDGVELVRQLGNMGYLGSLILISGEDKRILKSVLQLAAGYRLQVLGALEKPILPEQLIELLDGRGESGRELDKIRFGMPAKFTMQEVRKAIDEYQLLNVYQPKVSLQDGHIVGVEALVRWQHPKAGTVEPEDFLGIAETGGLIDDLTKQMLAGPRGALSEARHWLDMGYKVQISVNISQSSLVNRDFAGKITAHLTDARLSPEQLMVEVRESSVEADRLAAIACLAQLRLSKVNLSIDDFGVGYSSFSQLHEVPFSEIKLHGTFVTGARKHPAKIATLRACIGLAKELGIKTVAEAVETRDDWDLLASLGCDYAQGHFISKPMMPADIPNWINRWEVRRRSLSEQLFNSRGKVEEAVKAPAFS
jgi:EAL domain-containing protein (putative c-di-GMP-specific phosphodiesterase class I)/AmiR/NasT family two-component response regulator